MNITISKTIQVRQYEPLTVTVSEDMDVKTLEDRDKLYKKVSTTLHQTISKEYEKFNRISKDDKDENPAPRRKIPSLKKTTVVSNPYKK